jgi:hypothetical protein
MTSKLFASLALAGTAVLGLSVNAAASGLATPGSLLVFPCYDNTRGTQTVVTVTNTNTNTDPILGGVDVEYRYINGLNCLETNRTRHLTPGDTLSVIVSLDNPNAVQGYLYVFAKRNGQAISFNHLIGASFTITADPLRDFELAPICFGAVGAEGSNTDVDSDGRRDLNGIEYTQSPDVLAFARFVGQDAGVLSTLCLVNLAGARFNAVLDFLIYNDNEEVFSAQYTIDCWDRVNLSTINGVFDNNFLRFFTNHAANEINVGPLPLVLPETGWFTVDGLVANSTAAVVDDPAILAALIESASVFGGAQLPWALGQQANGDLLNLSIFPDNN